MEAYLEEALRAKEIAEKRFAEKDFNGAKAYALQAKTLHPGLDGISQMVATFDVYIASGARRNGKVDYYSILGLKPSADRDAVKKQYKKMAVLLHPDKNKTVGADGAFKLVSDAWTMLSDNRKKNSYEGKRNKTKQSCVVQTNLSAVHAAGGATGYNSYSNPSSSHGLDTFWTVCTSCKVQYEYLRKYLNKKLSCKNCRGAFLAVETGTGPVNGSFPYCPWSYVPGNGYGSHGYDGVTYVPTTTTVYAGNGVSGLHTGHGYEYVSNLSFQWSSYSGSAAGVVGPNSSSKMSTEAFYQANGIVNGSGANYKSTGSGKHATKSITSHLNQFAYANGNGISATKVAIPEKKRKYSVSTSFRNGYEEKGSNCFPEVGLVNGTSMTEQEPKISGPSELPSRRSSCAPAFDARKLLIDKAMVSIQKKLEEFNFASAAAAKVKVECKISEAREAPKLTNAHVSAHHTKPIRSGPTISITVPDPDFHDFDKDRSEECFKPRQIWALYDEDDGMPRLYCLIREVVSVDPFKIHISYLNSKTDSEFGSISWIDSGFTKSCGHFRAWNSDVIEQVNIFSHLLKGQKAGRGGCIRIYPKCGDIWAVYRNWSVDWDRSTPDDVRHQYEMVEVLDDYSEDLGVCVAPLLKMAGFKTVYQRNPNKDAIRWIPRKEMFRFSHQVPSWSLKEDATARNLPDQCWDLDPAATPDELLHAVPDVAKEDWNKLINEESKISI